MTREDHTTDGDDATAMALEGVTKEYASLTAVSDVDLEIEPGEFLVIVGPSGCGKSTTLRMIAGLETISEGELFFDDERVTDLHASDRNVAMVFQNYALYPHMTARRNITFGMNTDREYTSDEIDRRVEEAAEILDIADLLDRKPAELSGGERQRVALGRAICRDPDVFLMDEPLSNLDAKLRVEMRAELSKLHDELGTTTVYVTHDQTEAMTLGDRVAVLNDGELQQIAPPQELYDFPTNRFVAEFIGDPAMNMIPVDVEDGRAVRPAFEIPLPNYRGDDGRALLGIRPEDCYAVGDESSAPSSSSSRSASPTDRATFHAEVTVTEPLGDTTLLYCRADDGDGGDDEFKVQVGPRTDVAAGDRVELSYDPERLHLFDAVTGEALYHSARAMEAEAEATVETDT